MDLVAPENRTLRQIYEKIFKKHEGRRMQRNLTSVLTEVGLAATVGVGYVLLRNRPTKINEDYSDFQRVSMSSFPSVLDKFKRLDSGDDFDKLVFEVERFLEIADALQNNAGVGGQFQLNRLGESIHQKAKQMCLQARSSRKHDVITATIDCERDEIDNLKKLCETILKNILLDAR